jgi:RNA polymerase sigma-70 factor (ECF subfamily)
MLGRATPDFDDLVQTSFEQVVLTLRRRSFGQECRLTSWGGAIASHVALNSIRRSRSERVRTVELTPGGIEREPASGADPHTLLAARRDLERLRSYLSEMRRERAVPVILCDVLGHSLQEAASAEGVSATALQSRLTRGRSELKRRFADDAPPSEGES